MSQERRAKSQDRIKMKKVNKKSKYSTKLIFTLSTLIPGSRFSSGSYFCKSGSIIKIPVSGSGFLYSEAGSTVIINCKVGDTKASNK